MFSPKRVVPFTIKIVISAIIGVPVFECRADNELYFDTNALHLTDEQRKQIDLSSLSRTDVQMPGEYDVTVNVNRKRVGEYKLTFSIQKDKLQPGLTNDLLKKWGVNVSALPGISDMSPDAIFWDLPAKIKDADIHFDFLRRSLDIGIPQAVMQHGAEGDIPPEEWDYGLPVFYVDYNLSGSRVNTQRDESAESVYLNLRNGLNLGMWRLRNYSYYSKPSGGETDWTSMQSWIERDIPSLRARLIAGETATPGLTMENFSFRGISLATQSEMLPDTQQGYAPEIRGVAMTHATVEIRQNGNLLYQTFVPPGAFVINDLYPTATSGDLTISVQEEDGTVRTYTQAYASPPVSIRKGMSKYAFSLGKYGSRFYKDKPDAIGQNFIQAEAIFGLLDKTSVYGGSILAEHYQSGRVGIGQSLGHFGAISLDGTYAKTAFNEGPVRRGDSVQLKYSKYFSPTSTSLTMAGYRYNTDGYYAFDEASNEYYATSLAETQAMRSKTQITLSQPLGRYGSFSLSGYQAQYRHGSTGNKHSLMGSWNKAFNGFTVSVSQSQSRISSSGKRDDITSLSVSIPLGRLWSAGSSVSLNNSYSTANNGTSSLNTTLSGTTLEENNLAWSVSQSRTRSVDNQAGRSSALSSTWRGSQGSASVGYSRYQNRQSNINGSLRGAVLVHPYGMTLSRSLSEGSGYALVRANSAKDVKIRNTAGISTDLWGNAVIPSLTPYRSNDVTMDTATLEDDADILAPQQRKIPGREALVLAEFKTRIGHRLFLTLSRQGKLLPMGTTVSIGDSTGIVNESGQIYLSGVDANARLLATINGGDKCISSIDITRFNAQNGILFGAVECK